MDKPQKHYAKLKKAVTKDLYHINPFLLNVLNRSVETESTTGPWGQGKRRKNRM